MVALILILQIALIIGAVLFILKYAAFGLSQGYDVPLVETPRAYFPKLAEALKIRAGDVVYDLGSGDGRVILYLARQFPQTRFVGIERNPLLITYSRFRGRSVPNARFVRANFFDANMSDATRVYAYLKTRPLNELFERGKLKNTRLVSRAFKLTGREANATIELSKTPGTHGEHLLHVFEL